MSSRLTHWDLAVRWTAPERAAGAIANTKPDVVLALVPAHEAHGLRQAMPPASAVPWVVQSPDVHEPGRGRGAGLEAVLSAPVKPARLQAALRDALAMPAESGCSSHAGPVWIARARTDISALRVLLAEDNRINQKVALRMLDRLGLRADVVADGREAVTAVRDRPYDVVLMDVQMPEMDGLEATRRIRARGGTQPAIVALTANAMAGDREACLDAGADAYLSKPVSSERLVAVLERVLEADAAPLRST